MLRGLFGFVGDKLANDQQNIKFIHGNFVSMK